jgi:hypothetical protein
MGNHFGPWASSIDVGGNPQLSAFWRQRLTRLAVVGRTSPRLSRGSVLWLLGAASLLLAVPTLRPAAVAADQPETAATGRENDSVASGRALEGRAADDANGRRPNGSASEPYKFLPAYPLLRDDSVRKEIRLTAEQERRLQEINATFVRSAAFKNTSAMAKLATEKREEAIRKTQAELRREAEEVRSQIEQLLTADQLKTLRQRIVESEAFVFLRQPDLRDKLRFTAEQGKVFDRLQAEIEDMVWQAEWKGAEEIVGVLTPEQRKVLDLEPRVQESATFSGPHFTPYVFLRMAAVQRMIGLDSRQQETLRAIAAKYDSSTAELWPKLRKMGDSAESKSVQEKVLDLGRQMRKEVDSFLTPEQLALLKRIGADMTLAATLILDDKRTVGVGREQREKIHQLHERQSRAMRLVSTNVREANRKMLMALTAPQRDALQEEVEHLHHWLVPFAYASLSAIMNCGDRSGSVTIVVVGAKDAPNSAEKDAGTAKPQPTGGTAPFAPATKDRQ